ncbi:dihydrofolate reductase family protein [Streptomyces sp. NPDC047981]|uniref:dihydrofolate reductase family protein n=1 Tax=Streptomyces sp. NPDC047981 TaxID=3154610 RepID=UPI0034124A31
MARKIVLFMGVSLDGYIEGPDRDISWHRVDEELHQYFNDELATMGGFLGGRVTHELMAAYWPDAGKSPDSSPQEVEFAALWRDMPKIVYSTTLESADWNTTVVRRVDPDEVRALKEQPGGDLALSGADLTAAFLEHDLIDAFHISVHPVLIGQGKPLFGPRHSEIPLTLTATRTFGNGVVILRYDRTR